MRQAPGELVLVAIGRDGEPDETVADVGARPPDVLPATVALYAARGYVPPYVGYLALEAGRAVGTCAFAAPPARGRVEIAYFTFPGGEGAGRATRMAAALLAIARAADASLLVTAQTLPGAGASATILARLGFALARTVEHPDDGPVWEWELPPPGLCAAVGAG